MAGEFKTSMHSGDAPRDLRVADPRPRPEDTTVEEYKRLLEARGDFDIVAMLYTPIVENLPRQARKTRRERQLARAHAITMQLTHEALGGAA